MEEEYSGSKTEQYGGNQTEERDVLLSKLKGIRENCHTMSSTNSMVARHIYSTKVEQTRKYHLFSSFIYGLSAMFQLGYMSLGKGTLPFKPYTASLIAFNVFFFADILYIKPQLKKWEGIAERHYDTSRNFLELSGNISNYISFKQPRQPLGQVEHITDMFQREFLTISDPDDTIKTLGLL